MPETDQGWVVQKYALYDFAREKLASATLFDDRVEADGAAKRFEHVIVVPVSLQAVLATANS